MAESIVAVGDNDQAIYRFLGVVWELQTVSGAVLGWREGRDSTQFRVLLKENYRSTPNILRVATQVIAQNETSADFPNKVLEPRQTGRRAGASGRAGSGGRSAWVASQIERAHKAGKKWSDFAVLYRHTRIAICWCRNWCGGRSVCDQPAFHPGSSAGERCTGVFAACARPYYDVACARVLSTPAWGVVPEDLVRLAERGRKERKAIYDMLQLPQGELRFDTRLAGTGEWVEYLGGQRKLMWRRTAREILSDLLEWLEIPARAGAQDQKYVRRLTEFAKEWEAKSETRKLPEFLEYLDYFQQANETISLDDEAPGDALQLMTVHGAKGLEFRQVFVLRVNSGVPTRSQATV